MATVFNALRARTSTSWFERNRLFERLYGWRSSDNNKVAAFAHVVRSGERGTEAAPATSEALWEIECDPSVKDANETPQEPRTLCSCLHLRGVQ